MAHNTCNTYNIVVLPLDDGLFVMHLLYNFTIQAPSQSWDTMAQWLLGCMNNHVLLDTYCTP